MSDEKCLVVNSDSPANRFLPALTSQQALARRQAIIDATQQIMRPGVDYGVIPGTPKDTLLKPGAEKLCSLFGLSPTFTLQDRDEDWTGERHQGEPFFYYAYLCRLMRDNIVIGECHASCNSWETKYRYRQGQRKCPECGAAAIVAGKLEYGGGWVCFAKRGGCGAKFPPGDDRITCQQIGRTANAEIYDLVNTIQKMAQKRALIGATLIAVNASEFYSQDLEDLPTSLISEATAHETPKHPTISEAQRRMLFAAAKEGGFVDADGRTDNAAIKRILGRFGFASSKEVTTDCFEAIIRVLRGEDEPPEES